MATRLLAHGKFPVCIPVPRRINLILYRTPTPVIYRAASTTALGGLLSTLLVSDTGTALSSLSGILISKICPLPAQQGGDRPPRGDFLSDQVALPGII